MKNSSSKLNLNTEARSSSNHYEQSNPQFNAYIDHTVGHNADIDYELSIDDTDNYYQMKPKHTSKIKSVHDKRRGSTSQEK